MGNVFDCDLSTFNSIRIKWKEGEIATLYRHRRRLNAATTGICYQLFKMES